MIDRILWVDSLGGLVVGGVVLALSEWLATLYGLPHGLMVLMGCANVAYGCYSGSLVLRKRRPRVWIVALVFANAAWAVVCVILIVRFAETAQPLGLVVLALEALFVGGLAAVEWRFRERLIVDGASAT